MDDILLSALQHYAVCPRQCALIHMEQVWAENELTAAGRLLHESVHSGETRTRDGVRIVTALELRSARLGLRGRSDAVELHRDGRQWRPYPVEYKKGSPHGDCPADSIQLCGQALCLEEMFHTNIPEGALYYGTPHRRTVVRFTSGLREKTEQTVAAVREMLAGGLLPPAQKGAVCASCSLAGHCMPGSPPTVAAYLDTLCEEEE
ncbi:CRISPR-associated protein Cas4 [uncultured Desulfovibrio sp.]|uniref:CRISPR-associated protein Cas4 n=1 Tax=uncultured Desulfovibrio sp. TaxID=167968 RepID=UPI002628AA60|nr:CRISPR-associated protein Cas4 [uncultured Desulfovibrio sp.]